MYRNTFTILQYLTKACEFREDKKNHNNLRSGFIHEDKIVKSEIHNIRHMTYFNKFSKYRPLTSKLQQY